MDIEKRSTRFGAAIILFAVILRLGSLVFPVLAHTLRPHRSPPEKGWGSRGPEHVLGAPQIPPPTQSRPVGPSVPACPVFTREDMAWVQLRYASDCGNRADLEQLLQQRLNWDLTGTEPTVLILHSHASESYTLPPGQNDPQWDSYRSLSTHQNMVAVGDLLQQLLEAGGISVIHDRQLHDHPSYSAAYTNSRHAAADYLQQYPSIRVVLDLHRDAALNADGSQFATSALVDGRRSAQLMLVMGSGSGYNWQENLSAALKLQVLLEKRAPGITRPTVLRAQRFNQDLCSGAMLVEVGTAGNTLEEALRAIPVLAEALIALAHGANRPGTLQEIPPGEAVIIGHGSRRLCQMPADRRKMGHFLLL